MKRRTNTYLPLIERALKRFLPQEDAKPPEIHKAMHYAVLEGGKRFRPTLVLSACEAVGGDPKQALLPACAVEMIHAYSLVHDDLPALDNDEMRRGKPTCHRKFGEAIAILTGDALLTRAFYLLSEVRSTTKAIRLIHELSDAAGTQGMVGGQVADVLHSGNGSIRPLRAEDLEYINHHKTGRLIQASAVMGAIMGTDSRLKIERIRRFGETLGLAFQVADDIMDRDGCLKLMSASQARQKLATLIRKAKQETAAFGKKAERLVGLADFLLETVSKKSNDIPVDSTN